MTQAPRSTSVVDSMSYEQRLNSNLTWALNEGGMHFEKESEVHKTLRRIAHRLDELGISYAVVGGMAMFYHGYRRFTEDVDILVTRDDLKSIHEHLGGLGYLPPFAGSRQLRDVQSGVRIEFLVTGDFPGDGKPKSIAFPDPRAASVEIEGVRCLAIPQMIELKILSGMVPGRLKDWGDVQELIRMLKLSDEFASQLHVSVRDQYLKLWTDVQNTPPMPS